MGGHLLHISLRRQGAISTRSQQVRIQQDTTLSPGVTDTNRELYRYRSREKSDIHLTLPITASAEGTIAMASTRIGVVPTIPRQLLPSLKGG